MIKYALLLYALIIAVVSRAQTECDTVQYPRLLNNSFQCRWQYFTLKDTLRATVIEASPGTGMCGVLASASITVVRTEKGDTIRILYLCDEQRYPKGQKVQLIPHKDPGFACHVPFETAEVARQVYVYRANKYDDIVMATTWAGIKKISYKPKKGTFTLEF